MPVAVVVVVVTVMGVVEDVSGMEVVVGSDWVVLVEVSAGTVVGGVAADGPVVVVGPAVVDVVVSSARVVTTLEGRSVT